MGGNALKLKGLNPKRIKNEDIQRLTQDISKTLVEEKIFKWIEPALSYNQKPDHGDLDLIGELDTTNLKGKSPWQILAKDSLGSKEIHWNKPVASLEYHGHQIDLTGRIGYEKALTHLQFCHYSPLGNILGRLIRKTGAKWGIDGLEYPIKEKDTIEAQVLKIVPLSQNIDEILRFCGLDPKTWHQGFQKQEDIFNYVCQSPLFNKDVFRLENLNHLHRKRDRTRPDYHQWLEFIDQGKIKNNTQWVINPTPKEYEKIIKDYQKIIDKKFPKSHLLKTIEKERKENEFIKSQKKEKFNGRLISQWTNLEGSKLGSFIKGFKSLHKIENEKALIGWICSKNKKSIKRSILDYKKTIEDITV